MEKEVVKELDKEIDLDYEKLFDLISCEWDKRKRCDSFYIEENNKIKRQVNKAVGQLNEIEEYYLDDMFLIEKIEQVIKTLERVE